MRINYPITEVCEKAENYLTASVCHAVKEEPRVRVRAIFDKGHVVTGLNAEHSKELHRVSGHRRVRCNISGHL